MAVCAKPTPRIAFVYAIPAAIALAASAIWLRSRLKKTQKHIKDKHEPTPICLLEEEDKTMARNRNNKRKSAVSVDSAATACKSGTDSPVDDLAKQIDEALCLNENTELDAKSKCDNTPLCQELHELDTNLKQTETTASDIYTAESNCTGQSQPAEPDTTRKEHIQLDNDRDTIATELDTKYAAAALAPSVGSDINYDIATSTLSATDDVDGSNTGCNFSDARSEDSVDSGKGSSETQTPAPVLIEPIQIFEFEVPVEHCGKVMGHRYNFVKSIREYTNADVFLRRHPWNRDLKVCTVMGMRNDITGALQMLRNRFPVHDYPDITMEPVYYPAASGNLQQPCVVPLNGPIQLSLPEGILCDVILSSLVSGGHFFLQQPTHPSYPSLSRLDYCMANCYSQTSTPELPKPIKPGVICSGPLGGGWFRTQVVGVREETGECDVRFVDYGGYTTLPSALLRQIRSDFMSLPFQAVECYLANICPNTEDGVWSPESIQAFEELAQGQILQAQVVSYAEDGNPCLYLYKMQGALTLFINRELVSLGLAKWIVEPLEESEPGPEGGCIAV